MRHTSHPTKQLHSLWYSDLKWYYLVGNLLKSLMNPVPYTRKNCLPSELLNINIFFNVSNHLLCQIWINCTQMTPINMFTLVSIRFSYSVASQSTNKSRCGIIHSLMLIVSFVMFGSCSSFPLHMKPIMTKQHNYILHIVLYWIFLRQVDLIVRINISENARLICVSPIHELHLCQIIIFYLWTKSFWFGNTEPPPHPTPPPPNI